MLRERAPVHHDKELVVAECSITVEIVLVNHGLELLISALRFGLSQCNHGLIEFAFIHLAISLAILDGVIEKSPIFIKGALGQ